MKRVALIARLRNGCEPEAAKLLAKGPPFDAGERGLDRHAAYLSSAEVVFVFEGSEVDTILGDMVDSPFEPKVQAALDLWRPLIEGPPRIGRLALRVGAPGVDAPKIGHFGPRFGRSDPC